ncbi:MAG: hypothetical protein FWD37_03210 [Methanomassiliicoccaceae archaeon]|nr:hypothetical protein [Methanomassiliicoccaceae archaeon]
MSGEEKPSLLNSFIGGLILTILLVVVVPVLSAVFIEPIVTEYLSISIDPFTPGMFVTAAMLLVLILFLLLLGGGKIFKKYGVLGVVGLITAYYLLERPYDAILPVAIIILFVAIGHIRGNKK